MIAEQDFKDLKNWRRAVSPRGDIITRRLEISPYLSMEILTDAATASDAVPIQRILWQRRILPGITESACPATVRGRYTVEGTDWMPLMDEVALSLAWRFLKELTGGFKMEEKEVKTPLGVFKCTPEEWTAGDNYVQVATHEYPGTCLSVTAGFRNRGYGDSYGPAFLQIDAAGGNFDFKATDRGVEVIATGELEIDELIKGLEFARTTLISMREGKS